VPVRDDFPLSKAELEFLRGLVRTNTRFLVVGVGAAVLQGADAVTRFSIFGFVRSAIRVSQRPRGQRGASLPRAPSLR
jgi:hypothetical protein